MWSNSSLKEIRRVLVPESWTPTQPERSLLAALPPLFGWPICGYLELANGQRELVSGTEFVSGNEFVSGKALAAYW